MIQYRIYTEYKSSTIEAVEQAVAKRFDGYTLYHAAGVWKGIREASVVIEVLGDESDKSKINLVANEIKVVNAQESVLVTSVQVQAQFV